MLLVCVSLLTACGSTKVNSNNTSEAHSGVDTENNVYSTKETEVATENEQDNTELGETFYTLGRREKPKILFAYDYSVNWKYIDIGEGTEYRQEKIEDRKGAEIIFWHYAEQFPNIMEVDMIYKLQVWIRLRIVIFEIKTGAEKKWLVYTYLTTKTVMQNSFDKRH